MASFVEWPTFRENLRSDFKARVAARSIMGAFDSNQSIGSVIGTVLGLKLVDSAIDSLVAPETLRGWADSHRKTTLSPAAQSAGRALDIVSRPDNTLMSHVSYAFLTSPTEFRVDFSNPNQQSTVTTFLSFTNFTWKVTRLVWPEADFDPAKLNSSTASSAQPAQTGQSAQPVIAESADTHLNKGSSLAQQGAYDSALAELGRAIELDPKISRAYSSRGYVYLGRKEYDRALAEADEAIRLDSKNASALSLRGGIYSIKGDHDKALADTTAAIHLIPNEAAFYNNRGIAYINNHAYDLAIDDLNEAIRLGSNFAMAYRNRGFCYEKKNELEKALNDYNSAVEINPKLQEAIDGSARVKKLLATSYERGLKHLTDKQYDLAIQDFDRAISARKLDAYYYCRGQAWLAKQDYKKAIADFTESIQIRGRDYFAYVLRAEAYAGNGERENAIADYRRALTLDPDESTRNKINAALKLLDSKAIQRP